MALLASVADLDALDNIGHTPQAAALAVQLATGIVQAETRQHLFYVENDTITVRGAGPAITLPERPVVGVPSVEGFPPATFQYDGRSTLLYGPAYISNAGSDWDSGLYGAGAYSSQVLGVGYYGGRWPLSVNVTYSHGYREGEIPDDLRTVCLSVAARLLLQFSGTGMVASESIGNYSVSYQRTHSPAGGHLSDDERSLLSKYRRSTYSASLA